jgi:hypothetical protein
LWLISTADLYYGVKGSAADPFDWIRFRNGSWPVLMTKHLKNFQVKINFNCDIFLPRPWEKLPALHYMKFL